MDVARASLGPCRDECCYAMYCTTDCRRVDVPQTDRERPTSGRRGGSGGRVRPLQLQLRLRDCCLGARSLARLPARPLARSLARTQALFQHRPPSASLAPYEATRPFLSLSPTLLCTPLAEGGRKRKGGWNERKRLAPLASLALHPRPPKARASRRGKRGREAATATVSSVAMPSPLPPSLFLLSELARVPLLPQWREGAPSKAACPSSAVPPDSRDPSRVARAYRAPIPPKSSGMGGRGRSAAPSFHRYRVFLPPTLSPPHSV